MSKASKIVLVILLLGSALRFHALVRDVRFHPDEALFATFARSAAVNGDWLLHGNLDKTPLSIYAVAESMTLFGITTLPNGVLTLNIRAGEFAARVPAVFASVISIALMAALARRLYRSATLSPVLAAALMAVSPLALAFSATAFTDSLLLCCVLFALWNVCHQRTISAGIWLALAFWCKQQALLVMPLVLALALLSDTALASRRRALSVLMRVCLPIALGVLLLFVWDAARGQETSLWTLALVNNDPGRLARLDELIPRLLAWALNAQYFVASGLVGGLLAVIALVAVFRRGWRAAGGVEQILIIYTLGYLLLHWVVALNIYDRYLLLILPPVLLLIARGLEWIVKHLAFRSLIVSPSARLAFAVLSCIVVITFILLPASDAVEGRFSIGGQHGEYEGIDELGTYLDSKTLGAIIYDHWLGWELGYYIGTWSDKRRVYYPTPQALLADALLQPDPAPRYFVAPVDQPVADWLNPLKAAHFEITQVYQSKRFIVYQLIPSR